MADLQNMSRDDLEKMARDQGVAGASGMTKEELMNAIGKNQGNKQQGKNMPGNQS